MTDHSTNDEDQCECLLVCVLIEKKMDPNNARVLQKELENIIQKTNKQTTTIDCVLTINEVC